MVSLPASLAFLLLVLATYQAQENGVEKRNILLMIGRVDMLPNYT